MQKVETTSHIVDPFHTDYKRQLSWETLGVDLLNAAENHASKRGFGMKDVNNVNYTWVLARLVVELDITPVVYQNYHIETWVDKVYSLFTNRNYAIKGDNGVVFGYARSIWSTINYETRKPVDLIEFHGKQFEDYCAPELPCPISPYSRIKPLVGADMVKCHKVTYSDIDMNGHVNSMKYLLHLRDIFSLDHYRQQRLRRVELQYQKESYYGQWLQFFMKTEGENIYDVEICRTDNQTDEKGEVCVRARLIFE